MRIPASIKPRSPNGSRGNPGQCFPTCNSAFQLAASLGFAQDACTNQEFLDAYAPCGACFGDDTGSTDGGNANRDATFPQFMQFIASCDLLPDDWSPWGGGGGGDGGAPETVYITQPAPTPTSTATSTLPTTFATLTSTAAEPPASTDPSASSTSQSSQESSGGNAWVAGPVVGSAAGVALIVALYYFWRRRRPKSLTGEVQEKDGRPLHPQDPQSPQVETESVKELSIERANSTVYEMPGSTPPISEKPANEVPAQELPANANRD